MSTTTEHIAKGYHWLSAERAAGVGASFTLLLSVLEKVPIEQMPWYIAGGAVAVGGLRFVAKDIEDRGRKPMMLGEHTRFDKIPRVGSEIKLADGTIINPGDLLFEVQITDNYEEAKKAEKTYRKLLTDFLEAMIKLCEKFEADDPDVKEVKGVIGTSRFASMSMAKILGFEIHELSMWYKYLRTYFDIKEVFIGIQDGGMSPITLTREFKERQRKMKMAVMSKEKLLGYKQVYIDFLARLKK